MKQKKEKKFFSKKPLIIIQKIYQISKIKCYSINCGKNFNFQYNL